MKEVYRIEKVINIKNVSDVNKLFRLSVWVLRFITNLKKKRRSEKLNLDKFIQSSEINYAKILWLQANQQTLEEGQNFINSKHTLRLEKDKNELYRAMSRIGNADSLLYDTKYAILLNRDHRLTELLVWDAHNCIKHLGERQTLVEIRCCYWVPRGKSFVKKILHRCLICRRFNAKPYSCPNSPDLPNVRVNDTITFYGTEVDYLGSLYCKGNYDMNSLEDDYGLFKCYVVLYTCASTRGVVLELVPDASSKNFVCRFRRFIVRRGCPGELLSDNGTVSTCQETQKFASNRNISRTFSLTNVP